MIGLVTSLRRFVARPARRLGVLAAVSFVEGLIEAVVLVMVVRAALIVAGEDLADSATIPLIPESLGVGALIGLAAVGSLAILGLHFTIAAQTAGLAADVQKGIRAEAVDTYVAASWEHQSRERDGMLQETVTTLAAQAANLTVSLASGVGALLNLLALVAVAATVDVSVTITVLVFGGVVFAALRPVGHSTRRRSRAAIAAGSRFTQDAVALASMARELRLFGVTDVARRGLDDSIEQSAREQYRTRLLSRFGSTLYMDLALFLLLGAIGLLDVLGSGSIGSVGATVVIVLRAVNSAQSVQTAVQSVREQRPSLELVEQRLAAFAAAAPVFGDRRIDDIGDIELSDITYAYDEQSSAIDGVSLTIERGQVLGVLGPSGAGKSTLIEVLLRLRLPASGTITVDGVPYQDIAPADWARLCALVPQEPRLMSASLADNIAFLRSDVTRADVEAAAAAAHVADQIRRLPDGFDTLLGAQGSGLSVGQKQRVAIARALVGQPRLLVLDEPTSALDVESERLMHETIDGLRGSMTIVIIAHRPSTLALCDRLVVLHDGVVQADGEPAVLAAQPGFFQIVAGLDGDATTP